MVLKKFYNININIVKKLKDYIYCYIYYEFVCIITLRIDIKVKMFEWLYNMFSSKTANRTTLEDENKFDPESLIEIVIHPLPTWKEGETVVCLCCGSKSGTECLTHSWNCETARKYLDCMKDSRFGYCQTRYGEPYS